MVCRVKRCRIDKHIFEGTRMKKLLVLCLISLGHAEEVPLADYQTNLEIPNGCCIKSIAFEDALKSYDGKASQEAASTLRQHSQRWVRVLVVGFMDGEKVCYHAICVFEYNESTWVYDPNFGTYRLTGELPSNQNPLSLATKWHPSLRIVSASYANANARNIAATTLP